MSPADMNATTAISTIAAAREVVAGLPWTATEIAKGWRASGVADCYAFLHEHVIPSGPSEPVREFAAALLAVSVVRASKEGGAA